MNMAYCRFRNTLKDMQDCLENIDKDFREKTPLSKDEWAAREEMISVCQDIIDSMSDVDSTDYGSYVDSLKG